MAAVVNYPLTTTFGLEPRYWRELRMRAAASAELAARTPPAPSGAEPPAELAHSVDELTRALRYRALDADESHPDIVPIQHRMAVVAFLAAFSWLLLVLLVLVPLQCLGIL
jgi:hypothetical protein